jgi:hypothetical protein
MLKQIVNFIRMWLSGEEAELHLEFEIGWVDIAAILLILILLIRIWLK